MLFDLQRINSLVMKHQGEEERNAVVCTVLCHFGLYRLDRLRYCGRVSYGLIV